MLRIRKGFKVLVSAVIVTVGLSGTAQAAVKLAKTSLSLSAGSGYMLALKGNKYPTVWKSSKPTVVKVMFSDYTKSC